MTKQSTIVVIGTLRVNELVQCVSEIYRCATPENTTADFGCTVTATDIDTNKNVAYTMLNKTVSEI